jgi:hypothetical protein
MLGHFLDTFEASFSRRTIDSWPESKPEPASPDPTGRSRRLNQESAKAGARDNLGWLEHPVQSSPTRPSALAIAGPSAPRSELPPLGLRNQMVEALFPVAQSESRPIVCQAPKILGNLSLCGARLSLSPMDSTSGSRLNESISFFLLLPLG